MRAPERIETPGLILRRPRIEDAEGIFARYASDVDVTRFLSWPRHESLEATRAFLAFSDAEWNRWPAGPYLVESAEDGALLGSTGFGFETADCAATGYVFAKDAWGKGYATEALRAVVDIARGIGLTRLHAGCHINNLASLRVLEKCGFTCEGMRHHGSFPNLTPDEPRDVLSYAMVLEQTWRRSDT